MDCSICGDSIETTWYGWSDGNNAEPVVEGGRCCDTCDMTVVIPARLARYVPAVRQYKPSKETYSSFRDAMERRKFPLGS